MTTDLRSRDPGPELPGLAQTLDRAAEREFDLGAMLVGIEGRVVHRRRRRRQLAASLAAVATVAVVGGTTWLLTPGRDLGNAANPVPPTTAAPTGPSVVVGPSPTTPTSSAPTSVPTTQVAYPIPDSVTLTDEEIGAGRSVTLDLGDYTNQPAASGQYCDTTDTGAAGPAPVAGRQWSYGDGSTSWDGVVDVVVTGWEPGTGSSAFDDVVLDTGRCVWSDPVRPQDLPGDTGAQRILFTTAPLGEVEMAIALVRVGDVLVAASARDAAGQVEANAEAARVVDAVALKLLGSGVEAAQGP